MNQKKKNYKAHTRLYLGLLIISLLILGSSFMIPIETKWFTIMAGFGCSGIASVVVAWLIDYVTCSYKEKANNELLDHLFIGFDLQIKQELTLILEACAKRDFKIDLKRQYSLQEIKVIIQEAEEKLPIWDSALIAFTKAFSTVEQSTLPYDPTSQHISLYTTIRSAQMNHEAYSSMKERMERKSFYSIAHILLYNELSYIEDINYLRNKEITCSVSDETKRFIQTFREAVEKTRNTTK